MQLTTSISTIYPHLTDKKLAENFLAETETHEIGTCANSDPSWTQKCVRRHESGLEAPEKAYDKQQERLGVNFRILKIFPSNILVGKLAFLTQSTASLCKNSIITLVFEIFLLPKIGENGRKQ
jgi:hypothetical protein